MKCLILGAGASFGASQYGDFAPPLVNGILAAAEELGLFNPLYAETRHAALIRYLREQGADPDAIAELAARNTGAQHLQVLASFIESQFGVQLGTYKSSTIDFERLFALIEADLLGFHGHTRYLSQPPTGPRPPDVLELQLKFVLCATLIAATRTSRCSHHAAIAKWLDTDDLVVSFNYDMLMDRALRDTGLWFPDDGYGLAFHRHGDRLGDTVNWRKRRKSRSYVNLLKPHGSLNWLYPRNAWDSTMNANLQGHRIRTPPKRLYCLDDMCPTFEDDYPVYEWWEKYDFYYRGFPFDLHSLIVPPSLSKPYRSFEGYVGPLWGHAVDALLTRATTVYIIGYSLRSDDIRSHWLLRKCSTESDLLKHIYVVDPSTDTVDRARQIFAPRKVSHLCDTIEQFASYANAGLI